MRRIGLSFVAAALVFCAVSSADARSERRLTYRATQVWSSAVRFLRVDLGYKILEKDKETGYLLFEYSDRGRAYQASLELIPVVDEGRKLVRARLKIEAMPTYVESVLLDKFLRKLRSEYGDPPPAELVTETAAQAAAPSGGQDGKSPASGDKDPRDEEDIEIDEEDLEDSAEEDDR